MSNAGSSQNRIDLPQSRKDTKGSVTAALREISHTRVCYEDKTSLSYHWIAHIGCNGCVCLGDAESP